MKTTTVEDITAAMLNALFWEGMERKNPSNRAYRRRADDAFEAARALVEIGKRQGIVGDDGMPVAAPPPTKETP